MSPILRSIVLPASAPSPAEHCNRVGDPARGCVVKRHRRHCSAQNKRFAEIARYCDNDGLRQLIGHADGGSDTFSWAESEEHEIGRQRLKSAREGCARVDVPDERQRDKRRNRLREKVSKKR